MARPNARFEALFHEYHPAVLAYTRRRAPAGLVDDVVNETFLIAWRRFDRIPAQPLPWLLAVARRTLATHVRSEMRREALRARLSREPHSGGPSEPVLGESPLAIALSQLTAKDLEAITLVAWDGLTPARAAEALGESPSTFRVRLHRARARLRKTLDHQLKEVPDAR